MIDDSLINLRDRMVRNKHLIEKLRRLREMMNLAELENS